MGRWIPWEQAAGAWQMAADSYLLDHPIDAPLLRFYSWTTDTLSVGYHQSIEKLPQNQTLATIPWIRRPTGGRAVLHQKSEMVADLTYSLIVSATHFKGSRIDIYKQLCQFLIQGLAQLGIELDPVSDFTQGCRSYSSEVSCFATQTPADLTYQGLKLMGNAQVWKQGYILQQGSLLLRPNRQQWEATLPGSANKLVGLFEILNESISLQDLQSLFTESAARCFQSSWSHQPWTDQEIEQITPNQAKFILHP